MELEMDPMDDIVCHILDNPFCSLNDDDKRLIVMKGRPTVMVPLTGVKIRRLGQLTTVKFKHTWFASWPWLCSSPALQKLFCWPCLLFSTKQNHWSKLGYTDMGTVMTALRTHDETFDHIKSLLSYKNFTRDHNIVTDALKEDSKLIKLQHSENVRLNRIVFRSVIDAALYLGQQDLHFRGHEEIQDSVRHNNFKKFLELLVSRSPLEIKNHYEKIKTHFSEDSTGTQNEINMCVSDYINSRIIKDINETPFFSLLVDDATVNTQISRCSIIIRYVDSRGEIVERFLGFHNLSADRTSDAVYSVLEPILKYIDCKKLIGQCYDGAIVPIGHLNVLQEKVKAIAPVAVFVHPLSHRLDTVLQDSLKKIADCRIFFASLDGISSCLHYLSNKSIAFASMSEKCIPTIEPRWCSTSDLIYTIVDDWHILKEMFAFFVTFEHSDQKSIQSARVILNDMNDFDFTFLVVVFNEIFVTAYSLYKVIQEQSLDTNVCFQQMLQTREMLNEKRNDEYFITIFNKATEMTVLNVTEDLSYSDVTAKYKVLFCEILDHVLTEIDIRFQDYGKLQFVSLADPTKFLEHIWCFPTDVFESFRAFYVDAFTKASHLRLKGELGLIYGNESLINLPLQELLLELNKQKDIFREAYKMFSLVATIPSTVGATGILSHLKSIKVHPSNIICQEELSCLTVISIENELLQDLKNDQTFYEDIIDEYASLKNREIDLVYTN